jgi:hypothetical protein
MLTVEAAAKADFGSFRSLRRLCKRHQDVIHLCRLLTVVIPFNPAHILEGSEISPSLVQLHERVGIFCYHPYGVILTWHRREQSQLQDVNENEIESNWDQVVDRSIIYPFLRCLYLNFASDSFDGMELKPELLRGIYAYG